MLREKLKDFRTIKLKRHHYILWWFWAAAIIAFTSIFWFQNIWTHAKEAEYPNITIPANNICTVINDTQVDVNWTWEINVYCRLWVCVYPELPVPNTWLHYNSDVINVYNNGSATCLVACDEGNEWNEGSEWNEGIQLRTDCNSTINPDDFKDLQYDNVFTFTFQWISAWTSDIRLLANSFQWTGWWNMEQDHGFLFWFPRQWRKKENNRQDCSCGGNKVSVSYRHDRLEKQRTGKEKDRSCGIPYWRTAENSNAAFYIKSGAANRNPNPKIQFSDLLRVKHEKVFWNHY